MIEKIIKYRRIIIIAFIFLTVIYLLFFSRFKMQNLPTGEYIESLDSPNGNYTLKSYKYSGGATMDWSLRVEVIDHVESKKTNIYYKYHESDSDMKWLNNDTVIINGNKLNIFHDYLYE